MSHVIIDTLKRLDAINETIKADAARRTAALEGLIAKADGEDKIRLTQKRNALQTGINAVEGDMLDGEFENALIVLAEMVYTSTNGAHEGFALAENVVQNAIRFPDC